MLEVTRGHPGDPVAACEELPCAAHKPQADNAGYLSLVYLRLVGI